MASLFFAGLIAALSPAQDPGPDFDRLVHEYRDLSADQFLRRYGVGRSSAKPLELDLSHIEYLDLIQTRIKPLKERQALRDEELRALRRNGVIVLDRWEFPSFGHAFYDIFRNDQPLFVTTDSILHAFHKSFDEFLLQTEHAYLAPLLDEILGASFRASRDLAEEYREDPVMRPAVEDVGFLLEVALGLLKNRSGETLRAQEALRQAKSGQLMKISFLGRPRMVDFSQFKPRGHYVRSEELKRYFRCMMWLGREDLAFRISESYRETLGALALLEAIKRGGVYARWERFDQVVSLLIGASDSAGPRDLAKLLKACGYKDLREFVRRHDPERVLEKIRETKTGEQRIVSSIFIKRNPEGPRVEVPRSAQMMGQRFTIDSFIFSNVVFDRIPGNVKRMMPSPLDAWGALGNRRALDHLAPEVLHYRYPASLAAAIEYVKATPEAFWKKSIYHGWLDALRSLGREIEGDRLAPVFRTAAWADLKLQTQLASWAQLRHDTVLYVKQSYTISLPCEYCDVYVDPYPEFFAKMESLCRKMAARIPSDEEAPKPVVALLGRYRKLFLRFADVMGKLESVARKEIAGKPLSREERQFLKGAIELKWVPVGCVSKLQYSGWYPELFPAREDCAQWDPTVADIHTQPADENGVRVGRVLHAGVGNVNLAVVVVRGHDGKNRAYLAPVFSYYEEITQNFHRMDDAEWKERIGRPLDRSPLKTKAKLPKGQKPGRPGWTRSLFPR